MNIILTGIPRSGTTLSCYLLNQLANVLALMEPIDIGKLVRQSNMRSRMDFIDQFFSSIREDVLKKGYVLTQVVKGNGTNFYSQDIVRKRQAALADHCIVQSGSEYQQNFTLMVKHPNAFTALLPELSSVYQCFATIRNPLSIVASWESLDVPVSRGHAPMAEAFDSKLAQLLQQTSDNLDRQLILLDWYFSQFDKYLPREHIIYYENVVSSAGQALQCIVRSAGQLKEPLTNMNTNSLYNVAFMEKAYMRLLANPEHGAWQFYQQHEMEHVFRANVSF